MPVAKPTAEASMILPAPSADELRLWNRLLAANLRHSRADWEFVKATADRVPGGLGGPLARLLIEEWEAGSALREQVKPVLPLQQIGLTTPKRVTSPMVVVEGTVGVAGFVRDARIVRSCGDPDTDARVRRELEGMTFRPAIRKGAYVEQDFALVLHIHVIGT